MPKKNQKSVEPVSLSLAPAHFHPRDWKDYVHEVDEWRITEKMQECRRRAQGTNITLDISNDAYFDHVREGYIKEAAVHIANNKSAIAFWDDVKNGKLVLIGYLDTGDGRRWQIPKFVWTDPSALKDCHKGRVSACGLCFFNVRVLEAAEAEKVPEYCGAKEKQPERPEPPKVSKGTRGRKTKWDWVGAERELVTLANTPDGLPYPQAEIEKHIERWFLHHYADEPQKSEIRKFVVARLPVNYRDSE